MRGRCPTAFPAPAPSLPTPAAPSAPVSELLQSSAPGVSAAGSPVSTSACSPDSWTRRVAAFQGCRLSSDGVRRITLLGPSATREKPRGAQPGSGSPNAWFLSAARGRVHSELDTSWPAQFVRDTKSMFQRPRAGTEACTLRGPRLPTDPSSRSPQEQGTGCQCPALSLQDRAGR